MRFRGITKLLLIAIALLALQAHASPEKPAPSYKDTMCNTLSTMTLAIADAKEKGVPKEKTHAAVALSISRFREDTLAANPKTKEWLDSITPLTQDILKDATEKIYATIGPTPQQWAEDMLSACASGMTYAPAPEGKTTPPSH